MRSQFTNRLLNAKSSFDFVAAHFRCEENKFSAANPDGYVNLGSAQNFLSKNEISQRLESLVWHAEDTPYRQFRGTYDCRATVANYLSELAATDIDPDHVVIGNGLISVLEALTIAILNPGDHVLIPTPVFPGLVTAMTSRTRAHFDPIEAKQEDDFRFSPEIMRTEIQQRLDSGQRPKAVLLCSPGNPIGQVYSAAQVQEFVRIAEQFNIALIVDEIYASSCFEGVAFVSALSMRSQNVFVIGGLSKDFGLAGYSTAWAHSLNPEVLAAMKRQSHFFRLPAPVQRSMESFLETDWRREFTQRNRTRLTEYHQIAARQLRDIGVTVTRAQAGLVLWLDMRSFLKSHDEHGQLELYRYLLSEHRVHVSPASGFHFSQSGFYRICFSQQPETLLEGLRRIKQGLRQFQTLDDQQLVGA